MSKHLRRPQSPRSRVVVLGAVVLAAASVTTATMALGQAGGTTSGAVAKVAAVQPARTYACPGTAVHVARSGPSAVSLTCSAGVHQAGHTTTAAVRSGAVATAHLPAGSAAGTLLVSTVLTPAAATVTMPGWTKAYDAVSGAGGLRLSAWYRTAAAAEQAPAAAVSPAGRVSMIVTAFAGARATAPVASAAAVPGFTPPTTGSGVDGARRVTAVGLRVRHLPPARPDTAARSQVANGSTRLTQTVTAERTTAGGAAHAARTHRTGVAVSGALTVLPRPAAAVPAGAIVVPVGGRVAADCQGTALTYAVAGATVVTVTCDGGTPTASPSPSTTAPTSSPTSSPATSPTTTATTSPSTTTSSSTSSTTTTTQPPATTSTAPPAPPAGRACTAPVFRTSDPNGGWSTNGYYVHNNMWNIGKYPSLKETLEACSHGSWNVTATADDNSHNGEVKTYPNVHVDYHGSGANGEPAWSSFKSMRSTFAAQGAGVGVYDVAYDIWMNGVPGNREVMIWTENHGQRPAGDIFASGVTFSGITWDVWATGDNGYLAFTPRSTLPSGSLDLKAMIDYLVAHGRVPANSTLGQVGFGVEVVSTGGKPATFHFTDFSVTSS